MVYGRGSLFVIGALLLVASLLDWTEARGVMSPSLDVGKKLREHHAGRAAKPISGTKTRNPRPFEFGAGVYKEMDIMERAPRQRNGVSTTVYKNARWPNAVVPYVITGSFTSAQIAVIQSAMGQFASNTCVRFVPRTTEALYISITNGASGCWSYVGRSTLNSENQVNLQSPECVDIGTATHELMHSIGFYHEFTRPDRDEWVSIDQGAFDPQYQTATFYQDNFAKMAATDVVLYGRGYDYGSVMHYSKYAAAASNTRPVMNNLKPWTGDFGNDNGLSAADIIDINYMYCNSTSTTTTTTTQAATTTTTTTTKAAATTTTTTTTSKAATTTTAQGATSTTTKAATTTTSKAATTTTTKAATTTTTAPRTTTTIRTFPTLIPRTGILTTLFEVPITRFLELLRSLPLFNFFSLG
ncbi:zinc metalloproteinase nas-1-like [Anopheles nili]|uniref:zinc metalloproteinase nas-1-like n=1 Tax=Anopheles nili TaxID=185578 RepID=UPI00237AE1B5|nr:zinc metalloproteinase nas-1-like [Anopheles nili]